MPERTPLEKKRIVVADISESAEAAAYDDAEARRSREKQELRGPRGFLTKLWKFNLADEYYRQKAIGASRERIEESGSLYGASPRDQEAHARAMHAIVERFTNEYAETLHGEAGETRTELPEDDETKTVIMNLIRSYAERPMEGPMTDEEFCGERNRALQEIRGITPDLFDRGVMFADNLLEIAQHVRQNVEHGQRLEDLDLDFDVIVGKAKAGVRTEAQYKTIDRIIEKISHSRAGALAHETTIASGVAIAYSLGAAASQRIARSKLAAWGTFGATAAFGAGFAAARERKHLEDMRRQHFREMAQGKHFDPDQSPERKTMEAFRYETRQASELITLLKQPLYEAQDDGSETLRAQLTQEELATALGNLADIEARIILSDHEKIDLISYSDIHLVEQERLALDIARATIKRDLASLIEKQGQDLLPEQTRTFAQNLEHIKEARILQLIEGDTGIEARNRAFTAMKRRRVAWAAAGALGTGLVVGAAVQEVAAAMHEPTEGLFERHSEKTTHFTALEALRRWMTGEQVAHAATLNGVEIAGGVADIPRDCEIAQNTNGRISFTHNGDIVMGEIRLNADGTLPDTVRQDLLQKGYIANNYPHTITHTTEEAVTLQPRDFADKHPEILTQISRRLWYDNNTKKPIFDLNELKLWWGGTGNKGVDQNGNFIFNVARMTKEGSFHGKFSTDAAALVKSGEAKLLLSLSQDTQGEVFTVPIDMDGNAKINPASEIGKLFFKTDAHGKAMFMGKFAEVAHLTGATYGSNNAQGVHILATYEGKGIPTIPDTIKKEVQEQVPRWCIEPIPGQAEPIPSPDFPHSPLRATDYEVPPFIPLSRRKHLEPTDARVASKNTETYYYGYGDKNAFGLLPRETYRERMVGEIRDNKEVDLSGHDGDLIQEYLSRQDASYRADLERVVESAPPMRPHTEAVITVPAYHEGGNLEKTLRNYAKLGGRDTFEIVILENHPRSVERDDTPAVIERMQREFPDMRIVHLYKVFDEKPPIGLVRKYLADAVLLRKQQVGVNENIVLISNDADLEDISEKYATTIINQFKKHKEIDAIGAKWDFPVESFRQFPLFHASQRLWHYLDIAIRYHYLKSPDLIGRNSAFRSSVYAAVGGYNPRAELAEDLEIGWLIKEARGYDAKRIGYLNSAWLVSNPRRAVAKMLSGGRIVQQYGDFHVNEDIRRAPLEDLLREKRDFEDDEFGKEVQSIYEHYARWKKSSGGWMEDDYLERSFTRAMGWLGVEFQRENNTVIATDLSKLKAGLERNAHT